VVVAGVAAEPGGSAGVDLVSRALLASTSFVWPEATPSVGCSSCSPSKKCLEKRCINISCVHHLRNVWRRDV
jgi:hypothetical protein